MYKIINRIKIFILQVKVYNSIKQWERTLCSSQTNQKNKKILITALRNHTWIEWAVYCGFVAIKMGYSSTILYKQSEIERLYNSKYFNFWNRVKNIDDIEFINIEDLKYNQTDFEKYYDVSYKSVLSALAYDEHIETEDIINNIDYFKEKLEKLRFESSQNGARLKNLFNKFRYYQFICYSGIISDTPLLLQAAIDSNQSVVCVEGWAWRPGHMIYNFNAPALEYNIKGWMNYFGKWDNQKEKEINKYLKFLDGEKPKDGWLKNFHFVQLEQKKDVLPNTLFNFLQAESKVFLLACNVIGDSSLIGRETIFKSHKDFIKKTVDFFKIHPELKLIIRAHPAEEWVKSKVAINLGEYALKVSNGIKNIFVIGSKEKLNTFTLIPYINYGLVWVSSAGVDLVVRGIPVIAAAKPKYFGLAIVEEPNNIDEYFDKIIYFSTNNVKVSSEQIQRSKEYLYVVFKGFSFEAQGRSFRADTMRIKNMPNQKEHQRFFRILFKEEPPPDRINV